MNCMLKGRHDARLVTFMNDLVEKMSNDDKKQFIKIRYDRNVNILDCRDIMYIKIENRVTIYYTNKKMTSVMANITNTDLSARS